MKNNLISSGRNENAKKIEFSEEKSVVIKAILRSKGITQEELAQKIGLSRNRFCAYLRGHSIPVEYAQKMYEHIQDERVRFLVVEPRTPVESAYDVLYDTTVKQLHVTYEKNDHRQKIAILGEL